MKLNLKSVLFLSLLFFSMNSYGGKVDKGYQALYQYDYFKAKKYFTKGLKYNTAASAQGLAIIYLRDDNPFHSCDSALLYIKLAIDKWYVTKERRRVLYAKYGFTEDSLLSFRQHVSSQFYQKAVQLNTVHALSKFEQNHPWAAEKKNATDKRDSLAFFIAVSENNSSSFKLYAENYPQSEFASLANENYHNTLYEEVTGPSNLAAYIEFINAYPNSPRKADAEKMVYLIVTESNTEESFAKFIQTYPGNTYIDTAWIELYQAYLTVYSVERIGNYVASYSSAPNHDYAIRHHEAASEIYLPFSDDGKYGFMHLNGVQVLGAEFDYVGFFSKGLAQVVRNGKFGFINNLMELQIPCHFENASEYINGRSVVERDGKFGLIDRNGRYILECKFDDLGTMSEDLAYASINDQYGYYDNSGKLRIDHMFDDAYDFTQGQAKVEFEGKQGYIDIYGSFSVPPAYENIRPFFDTLYLFEQDGLFGLMNHKCQIYQEPIFRQVGQFSDGLVIAEMKGTSEVVYLDSAAHIVLRGGFQSYPNFLLKGEFQEGIAVVMKDGQYGRIDTLGNFVTDSKYKQIGMGSNLYAFQEDENWGVNNSTNDLIVSPSYSNLTVVNNKYLIASRGDTAGILNTAGNIIVPFAFKSIDPIKDDLFIVNAESKKGVYHGNRLIASAKYNEIGLFDEDFLYLIESGTISYYDVVNQKLIEHKKLGE